MMTGTSRVYIVDDDEQMRRLIGRILQPDYEAIGFADAQGFVDVAPALIPGCLILDVYMPGLNGLDVLRRLAAANLWFPAVMITGRGDVSIAVQAMKSGAVDFIEKPFDHDSLRDSVRLAQQRLGPADGADVHVEDARMRVGLLSVREQEVLRGLVAGLPNKTIAYDLGLSPRTVEAHRARIMNKMHARSFSALVRLAVAAGISGPG